jgi:hypothetical protein
MYLSALDFFRWGETEVVLFEHTQQPTLFVFFVLRRK